MTNINKSSVTRRPPGLWFAVRQKPGPPRPKRRKRKTLITTRRGRGGPNFGTLKGKFEPTSNSLSEKKFINQ